MIRFLLRLSLSACAFMFILPMVHGIEFHGNFLQAVGLAVAFSVMFWLVDFFAKLFSAIAAISTLGLALLWLIPFWILGFWLIPAAALYMVAAVMPGFLTVSSWLAAAVGGLILFFVSFMTSRTINISVRK